MPDFNYTVEVSDIDLIIDHLNENGIRYDVEFTHNRYNQIKHIDIPCITEEERIILKIKFGI